MSLTFFFSKAFKIGTNSIKQNTHIMSNIRKRSFSMKKMDVHMMISENKSIYIFVKLTGTLLSIYLSGKGYVSHCEVLALM